MELKMKSGKLTVPIYRDDEKTGTLSFNPGDLGFVNRFRDTIDVYDSAIKELRTRSAALAQEDDEGYLALIQEISQKLCDAIDNLFGSGTCDAAFGCLPSTPEPFEDFFGALTELIRESRRSRLNRYLPQEAEPAGDGLV